MRSSLRQGMPSQAIAGYSTDVLGCWNALVHDGTSSPGPLWMQKTHGM